MVYSALQRQQVNQQPKVLNIVHQEGETIPGMLKGQDWSFEAVRVRYINLDNVKSVPFTKLESSTSQRQTKVTL